MREIKFRAWESETSRMYYIGGLGFSGQPSVILSYNPVKRRSLDSVFLMQFTGLHAKNGNQIYEGDIVRDLDEPRAADAIGIVEYRAPSFTFRVGSASWPLDFERHYEITGNIYENPELLRV
jgi:uncharacterized phage protein (TIGR01671 family)